MTSVTVSSGAHLQPRVGLCTFVPVDLESNQKVGLHFNYMTNHAFGIFPRGATTGVWRKSIITISGGRSNDFTRWGIGA